MTEWTSFYRLLNLGMQGEVPNHFELLAVEAWQCTPDHVAQALRERKKLLRESIPGPYFIPLLQRFETEQLEPAAKVLADPVKRELYLDELHAQERLHQQQQDLRAQTIREARKLVINALNTDGTLPLEVRPSLETQLRELGFSSGDINVLFAGIPTAKQTTPQWGPREQAFLRHSIKLALVDGRLTGDDERRLCIQAKQLGLSEKDTHRFLKDELKRLRRQRVKSSLTPSQARHPLSWQWLVPTLSIIIFAIVLQQMAPKSNQRRTTEPVPSETSSSSPAEQSRSDARIKDQSTTAEPAPSSAAESPKSQPSADQKSETALPAEGIPDELSALQNRLHRPEETAGLWEDMALLFDALEQVVDHMTLGLEPSALHITMPMSQNLLMREVELGQLPDDPGMSASAQFLDQLKQKLQEGSRAERYHAVAQLQRLNTADSADILLSVLDSASIPDTPTVHRMLKALGRMNAADIPQRLSELLLRPRRRNLAAPLSYTLQTLSERTSEPIDTDQALLPVAHTREQRELCATWWLNYWQRHQLGSVAQANGQQVVLLPEDRETLYVQASAWANTERMIAMLSPESAQEPESEATWIDESPLGSFAAAPPIDVNFAQAVRRFADHQIFWWRQQCDIPSVHALLDALEIRRFQQRVYAQGELALVEMNLDALKQFMERQWAVTSSADRQRQLRAQLDAVFAGRNEQDAALFAARNRAFELLTYATLWLKDGAQLTAIDAAADLDVDIPGYLTEHAEMNHAELFGNDLDPNELALMDDAALQTAITMVQAQHQQRPLDLTIGQAIEHIRERQYQIRQRALLALHRGLETYRQGMRQEASAWLEQVKASENVMNWLARESSISLDELISQRFMDEALGLCTLCGNTDRADCSTCLGLGRSRCPQCDGRGVVTERSRQDVETITCPTCQGLGLITCPRCKGLGVQECARCAEELNTDHTNSNPLHWRSDLLRLHRKVNYLRMGGYAE